LTARTALRFLACLAAALALLATGCGRSAGQEEALALLHAADVLRDAPSEPLAARRALLEALERQPATRPLAVSARDACVRAYRPLLDAGDAEARVRRRLEAPGPAGSSGPSALLDLQALVAAEAQVKESAAAMPACDTALAELRRAARRGD
jgi:hypothetical protein